MKVYVSNYTDYKGDKCIPVSHSIPKGTSIYKEFPELYPSNKNIELLECVKFLPSDDEWRVNAEEICAHEYHDQLELVIDDILPQLEDGVVFCCTCTEASPCHRHILMEVLKSRGVECQEI